MGAAEFCFLQPPYVPSVTLRVRVSLKSWQGLGVCAVLSVLLASGSSARHILILEGCFRARGGVRGGGVAPLADCFQLFGHPEWPFQMEMVELHSSDEELS